MIEHVHVRRVEEAPPCLHVVDERISGRTVRQAGDDIVELARTAVAFVVLDCIVHAEVQRRVLVRRGYDVPRRAPAQLMIERGEAARDMERRIEVVEPVAIRLDTPGDDGVALKQQGERLDDVTVRRRFMFIGMLSTAMLLAMNVSNRLRSSVWMKRLICARLKLASGYAPG